MKLKAAKNCEELDLKKGDEICMNSILSSNNIYKCNGSTKEKIANLTITETIFCSNLYLNDGNDSIIVIKGFALLEGQIGNFKQFNLYLE